MVLAALMFALVEHPQTASAIPLFSDAQGGVSCETCHTVPPNLNAYGRYIEATNFLKGIDPHAQMRQNARDPLAFLATLDGGTAGPPKNAAGQPIAAKNYMYFGTLVSGGYLGPKMTYYVAAPVIENGNPATDLFLGWIAYNGFSHGNGSLRVGKFQTPFLEPWFGMPALSLQPFAPSTLTVGQNDVVLAENRWGASYTQVGPKGLVGTVAFMSDQGGIETAYNTSYNVPAQFVAPPGDQNGSWVATLQYLQPGSRFTGGIGIMGGAIPVVGGRQFDGGKDPYEREMALVAYALSQTVEVTGMKLFGQDANPLATGQSVNSNAFSFGVKYNPTSWAHIEVRDDRSDSGPGTIYNAYHPVLQEYVTSLALNPMPNVSITGYFVPTVGLKPTAGYELAYTGPWFHHAAAPPETVASSGTGGSPGAQDYAVHCAACHGATGGGGVGPNLQHLTLTQTQTVAFIKNPAGNIMPHLYPSQLNEQQVEAIATYVKGGFAAGGAGAAPGAAASTGTQTADTAAGAQVFSVHCSACHGADGSGGVGPNLHGIASRKSLDQTIAFIENPSGGIMPKLYPSQLNQTQVQQVAAYIQTLK